MRNFFWLLLLLSGCGGGAVVLAPTPRPPDVSPLTYQHPGGAFVLTLPRTWAVIERNTTTLATTAFSPPGAHTPVVSVAVVRLGQPTADDEAFLSMLDQYQGQIRPDAERYTEQSREAMGDGSWRMTGVRQNAVGRAQPVNTFIEQAGDVLAVIDVIVPPEDTREFVEMQAVVNTLTLDDNAPLEPTALSTLAFATQIRLEVLNLHTWATSDGVFFVTGEVANFGDSAQVNLPVRVVLNAADGRPIAEALDTVMGLGVMPGSFARDSLRFGQGQPPLTTTYSLFVGDGETDAELVGPDVLSWTDESEVLESGGLRVRGMVTNQSDSFAYTPRVTVTVFDSEQRVIAAAFADLDVVELAPGDAADFDVTIPEMGGTPSRYLTTVQAVP